jgi:two-component system LytT family response regulator
MLKAIIVDDEERSRKNLKALVDEFCKNVEILDTVKSVDEGIQAIETHKPDLIFLDIQMQRETGFDLLNKIKKIDFEIIFTTAHAEYAIDAIKFAAIDYLLKPIDLNDLRQAIRRVEKKLVSNDFKEQFEVLLHNFRADNSESYKIAIPSSDGLIFINMKDIIICEAMSNYTKIHMKDGKNHVVAKTLKEYENILANYNFFRVHHSFIINLKEVKKYVRGEGGYVIMNNDASVDVSQRKKDAFLKRIDNTTLL